MRSVLRKVGSPRKARRARLNPLVLLLDAALTGELDVVQQAVKEVRCPHPYPYPHPHPHPVAVCGEHRVTGRAESSSSWCSQMNDPSQPNEEGITALHNAICGANYPIVDFLIAAGANVNSPDSHGW